MNYLLHPLVLVTLFPLLGVLVIAFLNGERQKTAIRWTALVTALVTFGISLWVLSLFDSSKGSMQLGFKLPWLVFTDITINFEMGLDGISLLMVLLTTFLTPLALLSTWTAVKDRVKGFMIFFLLLEVGMVGVFLALDLFLFYVFWEFTLVPMYFLIGVWGGPRRMYAAIKFFLYTMAGSILMLLAILWLGINQGTFSVPEIIANGGILPLDVAGGHHRPVRIETGPIPAGKSITLLIAARSEIPLTADDFSVFVNSAPVNYLGPVTVPFAYSDAQHYAFSVPNHNDFARSSVAEFSTKRHHYYVDHVELRVD